MKPLKLTIEGLKSVAESQTINFEKLAENGLFGIFGKTGSGKSTVLDAIVLALYGEVVESINNRDFVNLGCMQTRVELIFSVSSGDKRGKYGIERIFKFNKARTEVTQSVARLWRIEDDLSEYSEADNARELNDKIQNEIIGLKKEEFLKCIALPQGEFSAFIKLTAGERVKMVGKLFDLERYGKELQSKVSFRIGALQKDKIKNAALLESLCDYEPSKIEEKAKEKSQAEERLAALLKDKKEKNIKSEGAKKYLTLAEEKKKLSQDYKQISADRSIIDEKRAFIALFDKLNAVSSDIKRAVDVRLEIETIEAGIEKLELETMKLMTRKLEIEVSVGKIPEVEQKKAALNGKIERLKLLSDKEKELETKRKKLIELRKSYKASQELFEKNRKEAASHEEKKAEYLKKAASINEEVLLNRVSQAASDETLAAFSAERLKFLNELEIFISDKIVPDYKSDVNRLIDREIEKIKQAFQSGENTCALADVLEDALTAVKEKARANSLANAEGEKSLACKAECEKASKDSERLLEEGKTLSEECEAIRKIVDDETGGKSTNEVIAEIQEEILRLSDSIDKVRNEKNAVLCQFAERKSQLENDKKQLDKLRKELDASEKNYSAVLTALDVTRETAISVLAQSSKIEQSRSSVSEFDKKSAYTVKRYREIEDLLSSLSQFADASALVEESKKADELYEEYNIYYNKIKDWYEIGLKKSEEWCIINERLKEIERGLSLHEKLAELVKAGKFMEFIADEYLREVADDAERRVLELTGGKYGLVYDREFFVTDNLCGGVRRPVAGLSGGETFLVSLSLALALASEISRKALKPVDFFFLDEGFGTLDEELIDTVTDSLEKLRRENLTVGLITHVTELKNRIGSSITVVGADAANGTRFYAE